MKPEKNLRTKVHDIIFESDTPLGFAFDIALLIFILLSVLVVMLESVASIQSHYAQVLVLAEWFFTLAFTLEYGLRLWSIKQPIKYVFSIYGVIDLLSIIPTYLSVFIEGSQYFLVVRALRLMRIFRILKLVRFNQEANTILTAMRRSQPKITVFLLFIVLLCILIGSMMYLIEGGVESNFSSIPTSIYWAVVTLTTVGFGDITPITPLGKFFASLIMILGYAVIAVPTGIVSAEMTKDHRRKLSTQVCRQCLDSDHTEGAKFCKTCGHSLED
jgi:voltage-gated potassium channel